MPTTSLPNPDDSCAHTRPSRIAVSSWVGYGPLWLAEERGFFDEEGVAVDLRLIEVSADRITAMQADQLDASATTVDTWTLFAAQGADLVQVLATDESVGGEASSPSGRSPPSPIWQASRSPCRAPRPVSSFWPTR